MVTTGGSVERGLQNQKFHLTNMPTIFLVQDINYVDLLPKQLCLTC